MTNAYLIRTIKSTTARRCPYATEASSFDIGPHHYGRLERSEVVTPINQLSI